MGTQLPPPLEGHSPQFSAHVRCGQMAGWIKMPLETEVGLGPGDFVLDGDPASRHPILTHVYNCGQTSGWMKMSLGTEVHLSPGHTVLDGDPAPPKGHSNPLFSAHVSCGHGRPSQVLLSSCNDFPGNQLPKKYTL